MSLLEALANSLIHFEELLNAVRGAIVFFAGNRAGSKIEDTIIKAQLGEFVVVEDEIFELFNLLSFHNNFNIIP